MPLGLPACRRGISPPLANRSWPRRRCRMILLVLIEDRLNRFLWPKFRGADFSQAGGVPIQSGARRRPTGLHRLRDGIDVGCFRVDVKRRRLVLQHGDDLLGVRRRPTGAAAAAPVGVILQPSKRNVALLVRVRAVRLFSTDTLPSTIRPHARRSRAVWRLRCRLRRQTARTSVSMSRLFLPETR